MRRKKIAATSSEQHRILIVDDDIGIIRTIEVLLKRNGYNFLGITDPVEAIELIRKEHFDLVVLDYIMKPINGDQVVESIRSFNEEIYILLLTGHKDLAPPLETIRQLSIQGYCEKGDRFDQLLLLIESGIKSLNLMQSIKNFKDGLNNILEAAPKIYHLQAIEDLLEEILTSLTPLVNSQDAFILVDNSQNLVRNDKILFRGLGKYQINMNDFTANWAPNLMEKIGYARTTKKIIFVEQGLILPLVYNNESIGVIFVENIDLKEAIGLLEIYATQATSALNNALLHSMLDVKNKELNKTYGELRLRYLETIEVLRLTVDAKDVYTCGHSDRVALYAVTLGEALGLCPSELELLRLGGVFHDIGKIATMDSVLLKNGKLDLEEFDEIKKHAIKGAHILSAVSMFKEVVPLIRHHHERYDGKGYPDGLQGEEIPYLARILAVADAFDAMISDRQYRKRLTSEEARRQLLEGAGTQFDAQIVKAFLELGERVDQVPQKPDPNKLLF